MRFFDRAFTFYKRVMDGRYGMDMLNLAIVILSIFISFALSFVNNRYVSLISTIPLIIVFYRGFSRNIEKRRLENQKFMNFTEPWRRYFFKLANKGMKKYQQSQDTDHRFFDCPQCKKTLRVPAHRGKKEIECPHCGKRFTRNTGKIIK